jgi:two-component system KDP operon response regulator KdpE
MRRILVVEDEEAIRGLLRLALEAAGYEVVEAANGLEGLAIYHQTAIGLVITDLEMPVMDGVTMIAALRDAQAQIPVIVISGRQEQFHRVQAFGVQHIFQKPFCLQELLSTVHTLLSIR